MKKKKFLSIPMIHIDLDTSILQIFTSLMNNAEIVKYQDFIDVAKICVLVTPWTRVVVIIIWDSSTNMMLIYFYRSKG